MKLNLGAGLKPHDGYCNVDRVPLAGINEVVDLVRDPWPWGDASIEEILCQHFFEHIPGLQRPRFMEQCYRVLQPGACAVFVVPYAWSNRAVMDYTHCWPPVVPESFEYFNKTWREGRGTTHGDYAMDCDFVIDHVGWTGQAGEDRPQANKLNSIADSIVTLRKR